MTFNDLLLLVRSFSFLSLAHLFATVDCKYLLGFQFFTFLLFNLCVYWGRNGSPDVPKKVSPRAARPLKIPALEPDSSSSPVSAINRTPKDKSPKVLDRRSPRSPVSEV